MDTTDTSYIFGVYWNLSLLLALLNYKYLYNIYNFIKQSTQKMWLQEYNNTEENVQ